MNYLIDCNLIRSDVIICLSGGIDSAVLLDIAASKFSGVNCLIFDYPERCQTEKYVAIEMVQRYGINSTTINLQYAPSFHTMVAIGLDICNKERIEYIGLGVIKDDLYSESGKVYRGSAHFFNQILRIGRFENIKNITMWLPLIDKTKQQIIQMKMR